MVQVLAAMRDGDHVAGLGRECRQQEKKSTDEFGHGI
jgi:hypothetical protein